MMKTITLPLLFLLSFLGVSAQVGTLTWEDELCTYRGTFDHAKYTEKQLRGTMRLFGPNRISLSTYPSVWSWSDIDKVDMGAIDEEYRQKSDELRSLDIVNVPYWKDVKEAQLKELEAVYRHNRTMAEAYTKPEVLRRYPGAPECTAKYAGPLAKRDESLLKVWLDVNLESRARNADPDRLRRRFESEMASPDRIKYAVVEVMGFGWGNCANAAIKRDEAASDGTHEAEFRKLFRRVRTVDCDEP